MRLFWIVFKSSEVDSRDVPLAREGPESWTSEMYPLLTRVPRARKRESRVAGWVCIIWQVGLQSREDGEQVQALKDGKQVQYLEDSAQAQGLKDGEQVQGLEDGEQAKALEDAEQVQDLEEGLGRFWYCPLL